MHSIIIQGLLAGSVTAAATEKARRQDGPVDSGTAADCSFWETALDSSYTCAYFQDSWGISAADFLDWNPGVKADCSGIKVGNAYCVEVNFGLPRPTSTTNKPPISTTTTTTATIPTSTGPTKPSPTQSGLIDTCTTFYKVVENDTCDKIVRAYGTFTFADFLLWNPDVKSDCMGLWLDYYYCVGVPGTPTSKPTTTGPALTTTAPAGPSPTQSGIIGTCQRYYLAQDGDTCQKIVDTYGTFTLAQFLSWNPAVGSDCFQLFRGYYYCVGKSEPYDDKTSSHACMWFFGLDSNISLKGIPGTPTTRPPTTTTAPPPANTCNPTAPTPTQPTATCGCKKWHKVASGNTCDTIIRQYGITSANFNKWNPNVGTDCRSLWLDYYVCVGV